MSYERYIDKDKVRKNVDKILTSGNLLEVLETVKLLINAIMSYPHADKRFFVETIKELTDLQDIIAGRAFE